MPVSRTTHTEERKRRKAGEDRRKQAAAIGRLQLPGGDWKDRDQRDQAADPNGDGDDVEDVGRKEERNR
jgi:hypothetical protein